MEAPFYIITVVAFILLVYGIYRSGRLDEILRDLEKNPDLGRAKGIKR